MGEKCSLRKTVQPVYVGMNLICKVSFTPTGGVTVFPKDWCSGVSISNRQSCNSAKVGMGEGQGLACLYLYIVAYRWMFWLEDSVLTSKTWNNDVGDGQIWAWGKGNGEVGIIVVVGCEIGHVG